jgi:flagellar biosynthesis protein FlhF
MQVKKFEARTMKEALEMVKSQMGPDAIILSARDNNKSYGLVGEGSVEITAAVSEETLHKKKFVESKLRDQDREKFLKSPARQQKELIHKMVDKHLQANKAAPTPAPITQRRYIEIEDEQLEPKTSGLSVESSIKSYSPRATPIVKQTANSSLETKEVLALKSEIATLKQVISQFQQRPQNFLGAHPGADFGINFDLSFIFEKLIRAGIAPEIVAEMLMVAQETLPAIKLKNRPLVEAWVARQVLENTKISESLNAGKVHCFVGPAGSGKTSALIKLASRMVVEEGKKVALFTTDTYKVGASDQMKIYAQILNVPFSVIRNQNDWINLIRYISQVDCVLVDYTGLSLKNNEEVQMLRGLLPPASLSAQIHLVLSANVKDSDAADLGRRYTTVGYRDVIFTGLDESTQHGNIYNFMRRFGVPLHSFGIGPRVPDDFEFATKERLLDLIFKITNYKQQESEAV